MSNLFKLVLSMSLSGSVLILILLASKPLFKERFSQAWQYYVWLIVLLRLIIPYSPDFGLAKGLFQEAPAQSRTTLETYIPPEPVDEPIYTENTSDSTISVIPVLTASRKETKLSPEGWQSAGILWLSGVFLLLSLKMFQYARFAREIRGSARQVTDERLTSLLAQTAAGMNIKRELPFFASSRIKSPMLMGMSKTALYLPETALGMDNLNLFYVFRHELLHLKRRDLLYKWAAEIILCIHWFNPLIYVMSSRINELCELACDEAVAKELDAQAKKEYGSTLLMTVSKDAEYKRNVLLTTTLCEDKKSLKERLSAILRAGRKSKRMVVLSIIVAAVLCGAAVCLGAFSSDRSPRMTPDNVSSSQMDTINDRPRLTWEAVKELAGGSLSYGVIRDSFYYESIGSGLYIIMFPLEGAPEFSLIASSGSPSAEPMAVRLRCEPADLSLELNAQNLGIMMELYHDGNSQQDVNKLFNDEIPVPEGAKTYGNIIYMTGRAPDEIINDYRNMLQNNGWELADALGMKRYYRKAVDGSDFVISVLCPQEGGPQDRDITTVIRFNVETLPYGEDKRRQDEQEVRTLAETFGQALKMVALVAPADVVAESIGENYGKYVTRELLARWQKEPENAPGRVGSSPWPERIDILGVEAVSAEEYTVYGEIIEVTSVELTKGGVAAKRPVTLVVWKVNGRWLISNVTLGEYAQRGPVVYENTRYGFRFYLPETWQGYTIVEEQWQGTVAGKSGTMPAETGPRLLIRHPDWSEEDPRQDIPIMIFRHEQWNALQKGEFFVSAAPIGPRKLGGNSAYIFALPPRYNFAFQTGYEEVEEILNGNPLWAE